MTSKGELRRRHIDPASLARQQRADKAGLDIIKASNTMQVQRFVRGVNSLIPECGEADMLVGMSLVIAGILSRREPADHHTVIVGLARLTDKAVAELKRQGPAG